MRDSEDILPGADWRDCFEGEMVTAASSSLDVSRLLLDHPPAWISGLMALRNRLVSLFGLRTVELAAGTSAGGFPVLSSTADRARLRRQPSRFPYRRRCGTGAWSADREGHYYRPAQEPVRASLSFRRRAVSSSHRAGDDAAVLRQCPPRQDRRRVDQSTRVRVKPCARRSSITPSSPGRCKAPTAMKTLPLASSGADRSAMTWLRSVMMRCSKAA